MPKSSKPSHKGKRKFTKQEVVEAIKKKLAEKYNTDAIMQRARDKHDPELSKLVTAMNEGMQPETAAAALLKTIAHEDVVYDWQRS